MKTIELKKMEKINAGTWGAFACGMGVGAIVIGSYGAATLEAGFIYASCMAAFFD